MSGLVYRTVERWEGVPVYVRLISVGSVTATSEKFISFLSSEEADSLGYINTIKVIRMDGWAYLDNSDANYPNISLGTGTHIQSYVEDGIFSFTVGVKGVDGALSDGEVVVYFIVE